MNVNNKPRSSTSSDAYQVAVTGMCRSKLDANPSALKHHKKAEQIARANLIY